jgi:CheY-like chemotaxis protein
MTIPEHGNPINILLVENNEPDVRLAQEAFKEAEISNTLFVVEEGVEAPEFLRRQGKFTDGARPDLAVLDLNLPRKDGRADSEEMKDDPVLASIPVVIATTSSDERDAVQAYTSHADCCIVKPVDFQKFMTVVRLPHSPQ